MFLPIGDDVDNRNLPVVGIFLILANVLVCAWEARIAFDDQSGRAIEAFFMTWGLVPANLPKGHVTGVLTHMFVHAGLMHLDIKRPGLDRAIADLLTRMDLWDHVGYCNGDNGGVILRDWDDDQVGVGGVQRRVNDGNAWDFVRGMHVGLEFLCAPPALGTLS